MKSDSGGGGTKFPGGGSLKTFSKGTLVLLCSLDDSVNGSIPPGASLGSRGSFSKGLKVGAGGGGGGTNSTPDDSLGSTCSAKGLKPEESEDSESAGGTVVLSFAFCGSMGSATGSFSNGLKVGAGGGGGGGCWDGDSGTEAGGVESSPKGLKVGAAGGGGGSCWEGDSGTEAGGAGSSSKGLKVGAGGGGAGGGGANNSFPSGEGGGAT